MFEPCCIGSNSEVMNRSMETMDASLWRGGECSRSVQTNFLEEDLYTKNKLLDAKTYDGLTEKRLSISKNISSFEHIRFTDNR